MFNLEQSIAEWRQQMLSAGIKSPVPLEELELHLRDEIGRHLESGLNEQTAFDSAVRDLGDAGLLKTEFARVIGFWGWLGNNKATRINRLLGALWMAESVWYLGVTSRAISQHPLPDSPRGLVILTIFVITFVIVQELAGIFGGVLLVRGVEAGRKIVRILAIIDLLASVGALFSFTPYQVGSWKDLLDASVDMAAIWFLRPVKKIELAGK